jgi:hypothetical protein
MRRLVQAIVRVSIEHPTRTLLLWCVLLGIAGVGVASIQIDTTTDSVLDREDEAWTFYESSQELFGGDEIVVVALHAQRPFDPETLEQVVRLSGIYEAIPGVRRVDSLASVPLIRSAPDGSLDLDAALEHGVPSDPGELDRLDEQILRDRLAPRSLVSDDGRVFALNVILERGFEGYAAVVDEVRAALPAEGARISGVPVFRSEANARTRAEILLFVPIAVLAMGCLIFVVYRSIQAVGIALGVGLIGTWTMTGAMGWTGIPISLITMILPTVILALGCAYVMHVLSAGSGARDRKALDGQLRPVAVPIALSGLTTAIGFAVIGAVRIEEVQHVGIFGAVGVMALTVATLTVAPASIALFPLPERRPRLSMWAEGPLRQTLMRLALERRQWVIAGWTILLVVFALGALRLRVETDATRWFPHGSEVRDDYEAIRSDLSGISPVNVVVMSRGGDSVLAPAVVRAIDGLALHLEELPDVGKAVSIGDPLRQMHGGFIDDPSRPLPERADLIQQYMLLLDGQEEIDDLVTRDHEAANIIIRMDNNGSGPILDAGAEVERWWQENGIPGFQARTTGIMYEFARAEDEIALGQLRGLVFALASIALTLVLALRRLDLASIALVPNAIPVVMVFGFMGMTGVALDAGTVIVGSLALGIAVDDTMHLVTAFHDRVRAGMTVPAALDGAIARVAHPMALTTIIVGLGFSLLGFSQFTFTRNLGLLVAGTMAVCLLADLILLPALLSGIRPERPKRSSEAGI